MSEHTNTNATHSSSKNSSKRPHSQINNSSENLSNNEEYSADRTCPPPKKKKTQIHLSSINYSEFEKRKEIEKANEGASE